MYGFIDEYLDPEDWLSEIMFGLIMALGFTGAVRLGTGQTTSWELFVAIGSCNLAWAIIDGTMYAIMSFCERARKLRLLARIQNPRTEEEAVRAVAEAYDDRLGPLTTPEQRSALYRQIVSSARHLSVPRPRLTRQDIGGGFAAALTLLLATLPVLLPYLVFADTQVAVRTSNATALLLLFAVGSWWGHVVAASPWRVGLGITLIGLVLVVVTIALGG